MDEEMFPPLTEGEEVATDMGWDISFPDLDKPEESKDEDVNLDKILDDTEKEDPKEESKSEEAKETPAKEQEEEKSEQKEEDAEEIEFQKLLDELSANEESLEKSDDAIANIEATGTASDEDIATLKEENGRLADGLKRMEDQIRKLSSDKSDLMFKNAELEAFGWESTDPNMLIISRNLEKAKSGDDRAKSKVETILKEMLSDLTGEDYDSKKVDKQSDILSAAESYNNNSNPNIKKREESDDETITF